MTKEELEKEAKESWWNDNNCSGALPTKKIYKCGYIAGAEPREKRIAELEQLIKTQNRKLRQQSKECDKAINRVEILAKENVELKTKVTALEKENAELKETIRLMNEQEARDIRTRFPC